VHKFIEKLESIQQKNKSNICLLIAPRLEKMPLLIQKYDDPFLPFGKTVIDATNDVVCAYMFDLAAYLALGAAGAISLERTVDYVGSDVVTILHGPFSTPDYVKMMDETAFGVDAVTLSDNQYLEEYLHRPDRCAFMMNYRTVSYLDAPENGGIYWVADRLFTLSGSRRQTLQVRLAGESVLYVDRTADFEQLLREEVQKMADFND
jgi:hypothetical protein